MRWQGKKLKKEYPIPDKEYPIPKEGIGSQWG
jgi:hypothetical protein